jgi:hypothetical protein
MEGYDLKVPVQLRIRPQRKANDDLRRYYKKLLNISSEIKGKGLQWSMCEVRNIDSYEYSAENLISGQWKNNELKYLTVTNFSPYKSKGNVLFKDIKFNNSNWEFMDILNNESYSYNGQNLEKDGLYVELDAWNSHIFKVKGKNK